MVRAQTTTADAPPPIDEPESAATSWQEVCQLVREEAPWWGCSFAVHFFVLAALALLGGMIPSQSFQPDVEFNASLVQPETDVQNDDELTRIDNKIDLRKIPDPPSDNDDRVDGKPLTELTAASPMTGNPLGDGTDIPLGDPESKTNIGNPTGNPAELGGTAVWHSRFGPGSHGGHEPGRPVPRWGSPDGRGKAFEWRGEIRLIGRLAKRVPLALKWLARHQASDGSWSFQGYTALCSDRTCSGAGNTQADAAATSLGLLPFLASGATHKAKGPYQKTVADGLAWLMQHQKPDGDLRCGSTMYAHGLATITLCEAYGMTGDRPIGYAAQMAVDFLQAAQNKQTGGWRYQPGEEGDLSVAGWQIMALKSAEMAGLRVEAGAFQRARQYVQSTGAGQGGSESASGSRGLFAYQPGRPPTKTMTSVGLLCSQYLGVDRDDPVMRDGTAHLMAHLPDSSHPDLYFWYYATQVLHNQPGPEWDIWNRRIRDLLVDIQDLEGCAAGSWDPRRPAPDPWGAQGGRLMTTSLATLTLEVYYRYIPLYRLKSGDR